MDTASVRANSVTATTEGARCLMASMANSGWETGGSDWGSAPTVLMPRAASPPSPPNHTPSNHAKTEPPTMATIM